MVFCTEFLDSFWMGGGLESRYVGRVYGADVAVLVYYDATQHLMLLTMGVCTRNM